MELEKARGIAEEVIKRLSPYCKKIQTAGSIRRRKAIVKDIDIILIPSDPWNLESEVLALAHPFYPKLSGEKLKRFNYNGVQVDLYFASEETWATLLLIRTGSKASNIRLCTLAKNRGMKLHADGSGLFKICYDKIGMDTMSDHEERIAGDTEESIYEALGLPFQKPEERE